MADLVEKTFTDARDFLGALSLDLIGYKSLDKFDFKDLEYPLTIIINKEKKVFELKLSEKAKIVLKEQEKKKRRKFKALDLLILITILSLSFNIKQHLDILTLKSIVSSSTGLSESSINEILDDLETAERVNIDSE